MRARRVTDVPVEDSVGHTVIQLWWPWQFRLVMTMFIDESEAIKMVDGLESYFGAQDSEGASRSVVSDEARAYPRYWISVVLPCEEFGGATSRTPLFERKYPTEALAEVGHREIVAQIALGKSLRHLPRPPLA